MASDVLQSNDRFRRIRGDKNDIRFGDESRPLAPVNNPHRFLRWDLGESPR